MEPVASTTETDIVFSIRLLTQSFTTWWKLHKKFVVDRQRATVLHHENWALQFPRCFSDILTQHQISSVHCMFRSSFSTLYCNELLHEGFVFKKITIEQKKQQTTPGDAASDVKWLLALKETCILRVPLHPSLMTSVSSQLQMKRGHFSKVVHKLPRASFHLADYIAYGHITSPMIAYSIIENVLQALYVLHHFGLVHGDVKAENVLLFSSNGSVHTKLTDFSLTTWEGCDVVVPCGPAPESQNDPPVYSQASDLYGLGRLLNRLLQHSGDDNDGLGPEDRFATITVDDDDYVCLSRLRAVRDRCLQVEMNARGTAADALATLGAECPRIHSVTPPIVWKSNEKDHYKRLLTKALNTYRKPLINSPWLPQLFDRTLHIAKRLHLELSTRQITYTVNECVLMSLVTVVQLFENVNLNIPFLPIESCIFHVLHLLTFRIFVV